MLNEITAQLNNLISQLSGCLDADEKKFGWTDEKKKVWLEYFSSAKLIIESKGVEAYKQNAKSIIRSLDSYNIGGGKILESACCFENMVRQFK